MLILPPSVRVFVATAPADMRKSFDGLTALTREFFGQDPVATGHLYVFRNRPGDRIKVLFFSRNGLVIFYKRLEKGVFRFPATNATSLEVEAAELAVIVEGLELSARRAPRAISPAAALR